MTLGVLIDGYRREYGVTRRELASAIGMSERTFRRKMLDPDGLTIWQVKELRKRLHIPADEMGETICGS